MENLIGFLFVVGVGYLLYRSYSRGKITEPSYYQDDREVRQLVNKIEAGKGVYQRPQTAYIPEPPPVAKLPFTKRLSLFTQTELKFYTILKNIADRNNLCIFSKVRLEDLLNLPEMEYAQKMHYRGKVRARHVDFVLCSNDRLQPKLVIELDDWRHKYANRKETDDYKDKALQDAGLPVLRVKVKPYYDAGALEHNIRSFI